MVSSIVVVGLGEIDAELPIVSIKFLETVQKMYLLLHRSAAKRA